VEGAYSRMEGPHQHVRFQINGQYITRPLDLSDMQLPLLPVITLAADTAVRGALHPFFVTLTLGQAPVGSRPCFVICH
jgi:hypothetical protein